MHVIRHASGHGMVTALLECCDREAQAAERGAGVLWHASQLLKGQQCVAELDGMQARLKSLAPFVTIP